MCTTSDNTNTTAVQHGGASIVDANTASPIKRFPMRPEDHNALAKLPGNDACIDCGSGKEVEWASVSFGILFCSRCSDVHKQVVGAHFRSIKAGTPWTRDNLNRMKLGGNERFRSYLDSQGIKFHDSSMHVRYTCQAAKDYYLELKALVEEAKASVEVALMHPSVEGVLEELVTPRTSVGSVGSLDDSLELDEVIRPEPEEPSRGNLLSAITNKFSSGRRPRTDTEDTNSTLDSNAAENDISDLDSEQEEQDIIDRIVTRKSITSLESSISKCVHQCLAENKTSQSILYKWTASKMTPTVNYMGRSIKVDEEEEKMEPQSPSKPKMETRDSFVHRMGFSWRTDSTENTADLFEEEDYQQLLRELSDDDFSKLKAALRNKGALTSMCLEEMLYTEATSTCALPKPKRSSFKQLQPLMEEGSSTRRSRWAPPPHHHHPSTTDCVECTNSDEIDDDDAIMPSIITISRCQ